MSTLIEKHLSLLHSDDNLKTLFPTETFNVIYRKNETLKGLLTPSLFPIPRREKYVRSATYFKQPFCIHKSDIKTKKDRCGAARHFNSICCHPIKPHGYLKLQLIEQWFCDASKDIESSLWEREKYWQC